MTAFVAAIAAAAGFALCWFAKDKLMVMVTGTEAFIAKLEAKATALKAVVK